MKGIAFRAGCGGQSSVAATRGLEISKDQMRRMATAAKRLQEKAPNFSGAFALCVLG